MDTVFQAAAVAILGAILALVVRKSSADLALVLSLLCCTALAAVVLRTLSPLLDFLEELRQTAGLSNAVLKPLIKTMAIGIVTKLASGICKDAGDSALAGFAELCGTVLALSAALPLLEAVLTLIQQLIGGAA